MAEEVQSIYSPEFDYLSEPDKITEINKQNFDRFVDKEIQRQTDANANAKRLETKANSKNQDYVKADPKPKPNPKFADKKYYDKVIYREDLRAEGLKYLDNG